MGLPIDFEEKVRQPPAIGGVGGYPYSISAKDLMKNFVYASPIIPLTGENGLNGITEVTKAGPGGHQSRELSTTPLDPGETAGDVLYWDGTAWVPLAAPSVSGSVDMVLSHTGTAPEWIENPGGGADMNIYIQQATISPDSETVTELEDYTTIFVRSGRITGTASGRTEFSTALGETEMPVGTIELTVSDLNSAV